MTDNDIIKALDILCKIDFFGQRAGRELWNEKPVDIQNQDIENHSKDIAFLKDFFNQQQAEIERLQKRVYSAELHQQEIYKALQDEKALSFHEADNEFYDTVANWCKAISNNLVKETVGDNNG